MLDKKAVGSAAASDPETQDMFLQIMGIITDVHFQMREEISEIIAAANSHHYSQVFEQVPKTDGLYLQQHLDEMVRMNKRGEYKQCECIAHAELTREKKLVDYKHWICQLL